MERNKNISDYFAWGIGVKFKIIAMSDVEINQGGVKIKLIKGK